MSPPPPTAWAASRSKPPRNTASRRNNTRSGSVSSACDQSTEARRVCWRRTAVRAPPVSNRNRSCRPSRISASDSARTRAAASSIASGMPSRRRQISATAAALSSVTREIGPGTAGSVDEQLDRPRRPATATAPASSPHRRRRSAHDWSPARVSRRRRTQESHDQRGARVEQVLAVVQHHQHLTVGDEPQQRVHRGAARLIGQAQRAGHRHRHQLGSMIGARSTYHTPSRNSAGHAGPPPQPPAGSCRPRPRRSASPAGSRPTAPPQLDQFAPRGRRSWSAAPEDRRDDTARATRSGGNSLTRSG